LFTCGTESSGVQDGMVHTGNEVLMLTSENRTVRAFPLKLERRGRNR